ncbi:MAG: amino acid ABC transporter permease [Hyphomicrobiales bacterium]|nr:amino acid ABC transporter permease [Hyphomicrobiales bacterium]
MNYSFHFAPVINRLDLLLSGLVTTVWVSFMAILLGFALGLAGAYAIRSRWTWLRLVLGAYVEAIRNTPLLAQLFFIYFGLPGLGIRLDAISAAMIALVVNLGAYTTEIVRGGLDAVPAGQTDAGLALGFTRVQVFFLIVLKPALKIMFPALAGQFTLLMLATSILSQIGVEDLFHMASLIDSATYRSFEVYLVTCGFYLALALCFRLAFALLYWIVFSERAPAELPPTVATT